MIKNIFKIIAMALTMNFTDREPVCLLKIKSYCIIPFYLIKILKCNFRYRKYYFTYRGTIN